MRIDLLQSAKLLFAGSERRLERAGARIQRGELGPDVLVDLALAQRDAELAVAIARTEREALDIRA